MVAQMDVGHYRTFDIVELHMSIFSGHMSLRLMQILQLSTIAHEQSLIIWINSSYFVLSAQLYGDEGFVTS